MGIFIQTTTPKPPGTLLNLRFRTTDGKRLDVQGRVIWINQPHGADSINPGMGVQFVDLTAGEREQIMAMVRTFAYLDDEEEKIRGNS
jgi:type IV pilus assembly protein PilZ